MKSILLVEDNDLITKLYKEKLERSGFEIDVSVTVDDAYSKIQKKDFGIVLLDIMLPGGKNGFDLLERMKADDRYKKIPVLVVTNLDNQEKIAKDIGASGCMIKSNIKFDQLIDKINELIL